MRAVQLTRRVIALMRESNKSSVLHKVLFRIFYLFPCGSSKSHICLEGSVKISFARIGWYLQEDNITEKSLVPTALSMDLYII